VAEGAKPVGVEVLRENILGLGVRVDVSLIVWMDGVGCWSGLLDKTRGAWELGYMFCS
jgi:hypothetical protein